MDQSSPIFITICLNHHPMPIIKNKDGFLLLLLLLFSFSYPLSTH